MRTAFLTLLTALVLSSTASMAQLHSPQPTNDATTHYDWING